jgi:hypothetical protein
MLPAEIAGVAQDFQHGRMLYRSDQRRIYVLCGEPDAGRVLVAGQYNPQGGVRQTPFFADTWQEGDDPGGGPGPTPGLFVPQRGFGKVWREQSEVRQCLGYATTARDTGYVLIAQDFELGAILSAPDGQSIYSITTEFFRSGGLVAAYTRYSLPDQSAQQLTITEWDSGKTFTYRPTVRFTIVLDHQRYPREHLAIACDPVGTIGGISNLPATKPPLYALRFAGNHPGTCVVRDDDFAVTIKIDNTAP